MTRVLITGINGFVGSHLSEYLIENHPDFEIIGTIHGRTANLENIKPVMKKLKLIDCDIVDAHAVLAMVKEIEPDVIFHLAAQAFVPVSWRSPQETLSTNIIGSMNLFEAVRQSKKEIRLHIAGSSEEYGLVHPNETPIKETNQLRPLSPYGVSKAGMDLLGYQYFKSYGLKIIRTRAFNHEGPRRGENYVTSNWSKQLAQIEAGLKEPVIDVGNLESYRDFTDVRDMVKAYYLAATKCTPGEVYNICSEKAYKMKDMLDMIISLSDKKSKIKVKVDPARMRPSDVELLLGDCSKFKKETGWKPVIPFEKTIQDSVQYWREIIRNGM